jgi:hypothetical protein
MSRELGDGAFYVFYVGPSYFILLDLREGYGPKTVKHLTQMGRKRQEKQRSEPQSHRGQPASSELRRAKEDRGQRSEPQSLDPQMLNSGFWILDSRCWIPNPGCLWLDSSYGVWREDDAPHIRLRFALPSDQNEQAGNMQSYPERR